jgi:putative hemolysin
MMEAVRSIRKIHHISEDAIFDVYLRRFIECNKSIEFKIGRRAREREGAYLLRWEVFGNELGQVKSKHECVDKWDEDGSSVLFIARDRRIEKDSESVVASVRVTKSNTAAQQNGSRLGLPLEEFYDLSEICKTAGSVAQSNWLCTRKFYRDRFTSILLIKNVFQYAQKANIESAVIFCSLNTNNYYKATAIYRKCIKQSLLSSEVILQKKPRASVVIGEKLKIDELLQTSLPALVRLYNAIGFKICGEPMYNPKFSTYDIPMFMRYSDGPNFFSEQ